MITGWQLVILFVLGNPHYSAPFTTKQDCLLMAYVVQSHDKDVIGHSVKTAYCIPVRDKK